MVNTTVQVAGIATDSHLLSLKQKWGLEPQYRITVLPHDYGLFHEIENQMDELKREWEYTRQPDPYEEEYGRSSRKDSVFDGSEIMFESLHAPRLCKELKALEWDNDMIGKFVQVLGNLQIHKDGNCYISAHQVILIDDPSPPFKEEMKGDVEECWDF